MKLSIQTIKSLVKEVDVTPDTTIDQLREQIRVMYNWPEGSKIILVHKTKILNQTSSKLSEVPTIKEGDRIVVMKKSEPVQPAPPPAPAQAARPSAEVAGAANNAVGAAVPTAAVPDAPPSTSMFWTDAQVEQLGGMGFEAELAKRALIAAFGNTDRAVEYLISGNIPTIVDNLGGSDPAMPGAGVPAMPSGLQTGLPTGQPPVDSSAPPVTLSNNTNGLQTEAFGRVGGMPAAPGAGEGAQPANALMNQFGQMALADPSFVPQMLRALGEQNPALLNLIEQNPRMFTQLLTSLASGEQREGGEMPQAPQTVTVQLNPSEAEAVNRLCELGFSKESALQAYLACDKNEELAANFLFDNDDINE